MRAGSIVGGRFEIEREAGAGGTSAVFRAKDRTTGQRVALKMLHASEAIDEERFAREAAVLAELESPAILRYVGHGTEGGLRWLATEWLDGEDLCERLGRGGITVAESVSLARRVAAALALAHARGIVHRDVKPSNLFLEEGDIERVKVIDFGVVRRTRDDLRLTGTGTLVGTPGYMAPEQATGALTVDARADVFALGCVLFECLTGRQAFPGDHAMAVLARVLGESAPRVSDLRPDIAPALDALVARMMARPLEARPRDAGAVLAELRALGELRGDRPARLVARAPALSLAEQRLVTVVLVALDAEVEAGSAASAGATATVQAVAEAHGGSVDALAEGTLVVSQPRRGSAADRAATAARTALAVRAALPAAPIVMASGRGVLLAGHLAGEVLARGVRALARAVDTAIRIDEVTATLIGSRFDVHGARGSLRLQGEREGPAPEAPRAGRALLPFLGRDRELATLDAIFEACQSEPIARAVLVTGAAGLGKSRLQREFVARVRAAQPSVEVLYGKGEPQRSNQSFITLGAALRWAASIAGTDTADERRAKLAERLARQLSASRADEIAGQLEPLTAPVAGKVLGAERSVESTAAAIGEWFAAEVAAHPLLLVIDDLHEADLLTIGLVDELLARLRDHPFMVLAAGRPEVHAHAPRLWSQTSLQEIRLGGLARKACERLARAALGDDVAAELLAAIVHGGESNPFYLEELAFAVARGAPVDLPETVFGVVQASFDPLSLEARRALRAASIFGQRFWSDGVRELLPRVPPSALNEWLDELCAREIVRRTGSSDAGWGVELAFAGPLVQRAARASLTDEDRALGDRLAAAWRERCEAAVRGPE